MDPQSSSFTVKPTGFTILQEGGADPDLDIVFVHGLNGKPDKSWTYCDIPIEQKDHSPKRCRFRELFTRKSKLAVTSKGSSADKSEGAQGVFWPKDLLPQHAWCRTARVMTYGYDSDVIRLVETANYSTIRDHGEMLLNGLARVRANEHRRPLMFIVHSLGGLVVKSTLNQSMTHIAHDLRAIVESTFAIIFFGTPHRGSQYADFGRTVIKAASVLTGRPYNDRIVKNLANNTEVLTDIRRTFENSTLEMMAQRSQFESSTFQESRGFSAVAGFRGKVVDDDSSELGKYDRNDHIDKNHMDMTKFYGLDDPEYEKVIGEINRHITRLRRNIDEAKAKFLETLETVGKCADERINDIDAQTPGTLKWLYTAKANKGEKGGFSEETQSDLGTWLAKGNGIFWITGRPGSGKSTAMKYLLKDKKTIDHLHNMGSRALNCQLDLNRPSSYQSSESIDNISENTKWCLIGLFITNRGSESQRRWQPMFHGILLQLLDQCPELIRGVMQFSKRNTKIRSSNKKVPDHALHETYDWNADIAGQVLKYCKDQTIYPFKALIFLDGLDELEEKEDAQECISVLKDLCNISTSSGGIFKVCLSGRSEQVFLDLLFGTWRVEIHDHTREDIRRHVFLQLSKSPRFRDQSKTRIVAQLQGMLDHISEHAYGVFLWAKSVCSMILTALSNGDILENVYDLLFKLPTEMSELYKYTLRRVDSSLRLKAFIMLETVLRARAPLTLLELSLIVHVTERRIAGKSDDWSDNSHRRYPSPEDFLNPMRLQTQLVASCKCILETYSGGLDDDYSFGLRIPRLFSVSNDDLNIVHHVGHSKEYRPGSAEGIQTTEKDGRHCPKAIMDSTGNCVEQSSGIDRIQSFDRGVRVLPLETHADESINERTSTLDTPESFCEPPAIIAGMKEKGLEDIEREQYSGFDPTRTKVRLLHRSAKDFLLAPGCLDTLFENGPGNTVSSSERHIGNGHVYILYFARAWLNLPTNVKHQLRCHFDAVREIAYNAPQLEFTLGSVGAAPFFPVIDEIDLRLTLTHHSRECWPTEWFENEMFNDISSWCFTFPAFAVVMNMKGYIQYLVDKPISVDDKHHFINGKDGRPLVFFSIYLSGQQPKPEITRFLLEQGADIEARFEGKTAIESLMLHESSRTGSPHLETMKLLLEHGANPNSRVIPVPEMPLIFYPLLHAVAHLSHIDIGPRQDFMRYLERKGADLNGTDYAKRTFMEILYWGDKEIPSPNWEWLLRHGARITKSMISTCYRQKENWYLHEYYNSYGVTWSYPQPQPSNWNPGTPETIDDRIDPARGVNTFSEGPSQLRWIESAPKDAELERLPGPSAYINYDETSRLPIIHPNPCLKGICDPGSSNKHNAYKILSQHKFRNKDYYTEEAAEAAESMCQNWFTC